MATALKIKFSKKERIKIHEFFVRRTMSEWGITDRILANHWGRLLSNLRFREECSAENILFVYYNLCCSINAYDVEQRIFEVQRRHAKWLAVEILRGKELKRMMKSEMVKIVYGYLDDYHGDSRFSNVIRNGKEYEAIREVLDNRRRF